MNDTNWKMFGKSEQKEIEEKEWKILTNGKDCCLIGNGKPNSLIKTIQKILFRNELKSKIRYLKHFQKKE